MRAILIDDEIASREILENLLLRYAPDISVVGQSGNLLSGIDLIRKHQPDVVFLDVQMPNYYGYEIANFFEEINFQIIFVTAFDEYAVRAFELAAIDYLLKPIEISRFQQTLTRLRSIEHSAIAKKRVELFEQNYSREYPTKITLLDKGFYISINLSEIISIEGQSAYSKVYLLNGKTYTQSKNLKQMGNLLSDHPDFYRCHKSWLINKQHLIDFSKSKQTARMITGIQVKISRDKMDAFTTWISQ